jgi:hypothetical protein
MPERALMLLWGVEKRLKWAENIAAAGEAFTRRTGTLPTHIIVSPTAPAPPLDCKLVWRTSVIRVEAGMFQIGTEEMP